MAKKQRAGAIAPARHFIDFRPSTFDLRPIMRLLIATKNAHKTDEIRAILGEAWEVEDLNAHPDIEAPEETGTTFLENATIKAVAASRIFPGVVLSDDSGLEVDALGGAPGVYSARYAGVDATAAEHRAKLLRALDGVGARTARFRCTMVIAENGRVIGAFDGVVEGSIFEEERGAGGFGYDPIFVPAGHSETFAQLPGPVKNQFSHRSRALAQVIAHLNVTKAQPGA
jgi:XTP/dITP diphosphohydrolase